MGLTQKILLLTSLLVVALLVTTLALTTFQADRLAHCRVLLDYSGRIFQGHRPAAELGELGAQRDVAVVQRRLPQFTRGRIHRGTLASAEARAPLAAWLECGA